MKRFKTAMSRAGISRNITYALGPDLLRTLDAGPKDCYCRVDGQSVVGGRNGADCPDGHRGSVRCV
jgi:hypothetical protein